METLGAPEAPVTLTPRQESYLDRFNRRLPVVCEGAAANRAGESVTFLSRLPLTPELIDSSDPGAMVELATRIASHIPPEFEGQRDQILKFCAAALNGVTGIDDLTDVLGLQPDEVRVLRDRTKSVLDKALKVERYLMNAEKWPILRRMHHESIDKRDENPRTW